jgi:hypothetical protein
MTPKVQTRLSAVATQFPHVGRESGGLLDSPRQRGRQRLEKKVGEAKEDDSFTTKQLVAALRD